MGGRAGQGKCTTGQYDLRVKETMILCRVAVPICRGLYIELVLCISMCRALRHSEMNKYRNTLQDAATQIDLCCSVLQCVAACSNVVWRIFISERLRALHIDTETLCKALYKSML